MSKLKPSPIKRIGRLKSFRYLAPYIDHDYLEELSPEDAKWLADFDEGYYQGKGQKVWSKRSDALVVSDRLSFDDRLSEATAEDILIAIEDLKSSRGK